MLIRNDGNYEIFVIQFKFAEDSKDQDWHWAGDCSQFFPSKPDILAKSIRKEFENKLKVNKKEWIVLSRPFLPLHASGGCWQETGIFGTYKLKEAMDAMIAVSKNNPGRKFRVAKIILSQATIEVSRMIVLKEPK